MRIYMDACCLNRPFDDQTQDKIRIESDTILAILSRCSSGKWKLLSSEILDIEIDKTQDGWKKGCVRNLYSMAQEHILLNEEIVRRAKEFQFLGVKPFDSLHVAVAEYAKADVFLTTDKGLLSAIHKRKIDLITSNPVFWFIEVSDNE